MYGDASFFAVTEARLHRVNLPQTHRELCPPQGLDISMCPYTRTVGLASHTESLETPL